ncbi:MAG: GntR family transcriptional regulator [Candidatus Acidiferrales bacterium]
MDQWRVANVTTMETHEEVKQLSAALGRRASIPDEVARTLREMILSGKFKPGQRLVETRYAKQLGIGQPAVREALRTLMSEGLVVHRPNRGYCLTTLSARQVEQIFRLRIEWEPLAVEMAIENRSNWSAATIEARFEQLERAGRQQKVQDYYRHDLEFHRSLWALSGNPYLVRALFRLVAPYFAFTMIRHVRELKLDLPANAAAHGKIMRAVLGEDPEQGKRVARQTIESFGANARKLVAEEDRANVSPASDDEEALNSAHLDL